MVTKVLKIVSFLFSVFLFCDLMIVVRVLYRTLVEGDKLEINNIIKAIFIYGTATLIMYILKRILKRYQK